MNKNHIIVLSVLVVLVVAFVGIYIWENTRQTTTPNIILSSAIMGCAETDRGMVTKSSGEGAEQEPKIETDGSQINYSRSINHMCCRKAEIEKEIIGSTINIFENWSGVGCKCICFSKIEATLSNIPSGSYIVNVYEKGVQPGDSGKPMEQKLIITQNINIQ